MSHPIPFRTRSLNPLAPMVLCLKARESRSPPVLLFTSFPSSFFYNFLSLLFAGLFFRLLDPFFLLFPFYPTSCFLSSLCALLIAPYLSSFSLMPSLLPSLPPSFLHTFFSLFLLLSLRSIVNHSAKYSNDALC